MCELSKATEAEAEALTWDSIRAHIHQAVLYELPRFGGFNRGGSVRGPEAWRQASPEKLAECITEYAMAAIHPVLSNAQVTNGVTLMRATLERAGLDPASLPWFPVEEKAGEQ